MSTIKEQVLSLAERLKTASAEVVIKVVMIFVSGVRKHWAAETNTHLEATQRYPEGSSLRKSAETKYNECFTQWNRLNFLYIKLEEAEKFRSFNSKPVEEAEVAA